MYHVYLKQSIFKLLLYFWDCAREITYWNILYVSL